MGLEISNISELDVDAVQSRLDIQRQIAQEGAPNGQFKHGVLSDLVCQVSAILDAAHQENIDRIKRSQSLLEISADPLLADDDLVNGVLSNFNVVRRSGTKSTGSVVVVVTKNASLTISAGSIWEANGQQFTTNTSFTARTTSDNVVETTDRILTATGDGKYAFTIDLEAVSVGSSGLVTKDTLFVPTQRPLNFVKAFAASDFTGGGDSQTNAELIAELDNGLAPKAMAGRTAMLAAIKDQTALISSSIVGYGDAEMKRDARGIFPVSMGGRVDWYIRTQERPQYKTLEVTATLKTKLPGNKGIWEFSIDRDTAPGFYDILQIRPTAELNYVGSYEITSDVRGYDISAFDDGPEFIPDIISADEAAYTRFQTAVIQFKDIDTNTSALTVDESTADYAVTVRAMSDVDTVQDYVSARGVHHGAGDLLIKAAVPCFLQLGFRILCRDLDQLPDLDSVKEKLCETVNNYGFKGRLPASILTDIIHDYLDTDMYVSSISMVGRIRRPNGTVKQISSKEMLLVPDEPQNGVSARTVIFAITPGDIAISTEVADMPELE